MMFWKGTYFENNYSASEDEFTNLVTNFKSTWEDPIKFDGHPGKFCIFFVSGQSQFIEQEKETMREGPWD